MTLLILYIVVEARTKDRARRSNAPSSSPTVSAEALGRARNHPGTPCDSSLQLTVRSSYLHAPRSCLRLNQCTHVPLIIRPTPDQSVDSSLGHGLPCLIAFSLPLLTVRGNSRGGLGSRAVVLSSSRPLFHESTLFGLSCSVFHVLEALQCTVTGPPKSKDSTVLEYPTLPNGFDLAGSSCTIPTDFSLIVCLPGLIGLRYDSRIVCLILVTILGGVWHDRWMLNKSNAKQRKSAEQPDSFPTIYSSSADIISPSRNMQNLIEARMALTNLFSREFVRKLPSMIVQARTRYNRLNSHISLEKSPGSMYTGLL